MPLEWIATLRACRSKRAWMNPTACRCVLSRATKAPAGGRGPRIRGSGRAMVGTRCPLCVPYPFPLQRHAVPPHETFQRKILRQADLVVEGRRVPVAVFASLPEFARVVGSREERRILLRLVPKNRRPLEHQVAR